LVLDRRCCPAAAAAAAADLVVVVEELEELARLGSELELELVAGWLLLSE